MAKDDAVRRLSTDLRCVSVGEKLHRCIEGETDPITTRAIREHLESCRRCAEEARGIEEERIQFLEASLVSPALSPRFPARVVEEIRRRESEARGRRKLRRLRFALAASGVAAGIALAATGLFRAPPEGPDAPSAIIARPGPVLGEMSLIQSEVCPEDRSRRQGLGGAFNLASLDREIPAPQSVLRLNLSCWIEFSARFFPLDERRPCQQDYNQDGQTDASDAAHLFMLAVKQAPADLNADSSFDDLDLECALPCQI